MYQSEILANILTNSIPTLQSYVDDVLSLLPSSSPYEDQHEYQPSTVPALSGVHLGNVVSNVDSTRSLIPISAMQKHPHLDSFMYSTNFLDFPGPHSYPPSFDSENTQDLIDSIILKFSERVLIDEQINFAPTISIGSPSSTDLALLEVFSRDEINENFTYTVISPKEGNTNFLYNKDFVLSTFSLFCSPYIISFIFKLLTISLVLS